MRFDEGREDFFGFGLFVEKNLRKCDGISEGVEDDDFATRTVSRVDSEDFFAVFGAGHEEMSEIFLKCLDRFVFCLFGQYSANLRLDGLEEGGVSFFDGIGELCDEVSSRKKRSHRFERFVVFVYFDGQDAE